MSELSDKDVTELVAKAIELTKSIDRKFICQTLICAAAELLTDRADCKHMGCLQADVDKLHLLLDAHIAVTAYEKGFTGNKSEDPIEQLKALLEGVGIINTH